jgi:hypothetical protein
MLKRILRTEQEGVDWIHVVRGQEPAAGSCDHGYIESMEFDWLRGCWLLKKGPCSIGAGYTSDPQPVCHLMVSCVPRIFITNCI